MELKMSFGNHAIAVPQGKRKPSFGLCTVIEPEADNGTIAEECVEALFSAQRLLMEVIGKSPAMRHQGACRSISRS